MQKGDQSEDDPRDEEERLLMRHRTSPQFWCSPAQTRMFGVNETGPPSTTSVNRSYALWSPPMIFKEPLLKDCPELIPHLGAERAVLGKCLKAVLDQFRGHIGQHLDDCFQVAPGRVGTLDSFQFAEEEVGTGLGVDPFQCLNDLDAFLPIVVTVYEEAQ